MDLLQHGHRRRDAEGADQWPGGIDTDLGSSFLGSPHRYRVEWGATTVRYLIDGTQVAVHNASIGGTMYPAASDFETNDQGLSLDWLRVTPYAAAAP